MKRWYILRFVRARDREALYPDYVSLPVECEEGEIEAIREDWAMQLEERTGEPWVCREVREMERGGRGDEDGDRRRF